MRVKVLEVVYCFDYGGIRAFIMNTLAHLDREKYDVDIYAFGCSESPFSDEVKKLGAKLYLEPENISNRHLSHFISQLKHFMMVNGPYDVCHAHCNLISAWVLLAAKQCRIPIRIAHSHTAKHFSKSKIQNIYSYLRRYVIRRCATSCLACGQKAGVEMYGNDIPFIIVNNGIDVEKFFFIDKKRVRETRERLKIPINAKVYANISRLDHNKNHTFIIDVFECIAQQDSDAYLLVGGSDTTIESSRNLVERKIANSPYRNRILLLGPQDDMSTIYHLSDCWIYASKFEGLPFGPIELQAAGVPCLASDTITKEIDLGLGLITFLSLDDSVETWADVALRCCKKFMSLDFVNSVFYKANYSIKQSAQMLDSIYSQYK